MKQRSKTEQSDSHRILHMNNGNIGSYLTDKGKKHRVQQAFTIDIVMS